MAFQLKDYLEDLATVVNLDTGHGYEPGISAVTEFFRKKYEALGFFTELRYGAGKDRPFLIVGNDDGEEIDVLMLGHMDTVFPEGTAAKRPFSVDEQGHGRGPGCIDCKGGCVLIYYLLKEMKEAGELNFRFRAVMNADEERGSRASRPFFEELAKRSHYCFVFEPGRAKMEFVRQRKGGGNYTVRCYGVPAHSGNEPEKGASAVLELSRWVDELYRRYFFPQEGKTVTVGKFEGGSKSGSVPEYAEITVRIRCETKEQLDEIDREITEIPDHPFDPRCRLVVDSRGGRPPLCPTSETEALLALMKDAAEELGQPFETLVAGGGSDGNFVAPLGCVTVDGCGPCGAELHTENEYLLIESVQKRFDLMRLTLKKLFA